MPAFNNPDIQSFYSGNGTFRPSTRSNMGRLRRRSLGSISATSLTNGDGGSVVPTAGAGVSANGLSSTATSIASLTNSATSLAKGVLSAEAAQNAINAQKNLTAALTPGTITIIIGALLYMFISKK